MIKIPLLLLLMSLVSCATDQAAKLRKDRPVTLGWVGASYRLDPGYDVGISLSSLAEKKESLNLNEKESDEDKQEIDLYRRHERISPYFRKYPWKSSAFFFGLGATVETTQGRFPGKALTALNASPSSDVKYQSKSVYVTVPLGWAWIWKNGFSLSFDFGPQVLSTSETQFTNSGEQEVDVAYRDRVMDVIRKQNLGIRFTGGRSIIGYSF